MRSINQNEAGSAAGMSLEHTMTVEVLAGDDGTAPAGPDPTERKKRRSRRPAGANRER